MWLVGDWGQPSPWSRETGVKMVEGENGVYTGELSLPKGTKFDIKILKSTVSTTSGGDNTWSAVRCASTLDISASHDFGEFTDNLIPNGNFEDGDVKWTPTGLIKKNSDAHGGQNVLILNGGNNASSDTFVIPPNQVLAYSFYFLSWVKPSGSRIIVKDVDTQSVLFEYAMGEITTKRWTPFSGKLESGGSPVRVQIICEAENGQFDDFSLVSP